MTIRWIAVLCACTVAAEALAGGFWLPGRGVGPMGRAGSVVASVDDPNALWYNPANLTLVEGHELLIDAALISLSADYTRAPSTQRNGEENVYAEVRNEAAPLVDPQILFATDFGGTDFALGVGVYAPYAGTYRFPEFGPQRYALVDNSSSLILYQHLAFAWKPHPRFAFGAGIQNMTAIIDSTLQGSSYVGLWGEPEDRDLDMLININALDAITITGNFGLWTEPVDGLQIGASVQFPSEIDDPEGKLNVRLPNHYAFDNASVEGDTIAINAALPWIVRLGIGYGIEDVFDVEISGTYESWSVHDQISSAPRNVKVVGLPTVDELEVGPLPIDRNFKDVFGASIGGDYHAIPKLLAVRAGFMFETGAIPDETYSVFQLDSMKFAPTVGVEVAYEGFTFAAAYTHIFQVDRNITNSEVRQVNATYEDGAVIVGNGSYSSSYDIFGVSFAYDFGFDGVEETLEEAAPPADAEVSAP